MHLNLTTEYETRIGTSHIDNLTGLLNCGFFRICMDREIGRCQQEGLPLTLALIDIDRFASFNQKNGCLAGDYLLKEVAEIISQNIRHVDLVSRYAGDIYSMLMIETEAAKAFSITRRIKRAVEGRNNTGVTVSIGLSSFPVDGVDSADLLDKAYKALELAKLRGKNNIVLFGKQNEPQNINHPSILIVDDDPRKIKMIQAMLLREKYNVFKAESGEAALSILNRIDFDLILCDIMMPGMNGFEVCRHIKSNSNTRLIPIILVTALNDTESRVQGIEAGADDFISMPPNKSELLARTKSLIQLKQLNDNLADIENILFSLANTVEGKDGYTQGHIQRVSNLAVCLGEKIGVSSKRLEALRLGGALHDIGKIVVPDNILKKPGKLSNEEFTIMMKHAERGYEICLPLKKNLGEALDVIRYHHEMLDGSGYPHKLRGDEIPIVAQIMAVVDIYDALTTNRPYRHALGMPEAFSILRKMAHENKLNLAIVEDMIYLAENERIDEFLPDVT